MSAKKRVLVTGGSGQLAAMFLRHDADRYALRLTYHNHPIQAPGHEVVAMDLTDYASVVAAMQGMDAVLHLGADSGGSSPWTSVLPNNIDGTYNTYEAAREAGIKRLVFASSNHAAGFAVREEQPVGPDAPVRPDSLYGVSKCFGEALGRYYHDRYGMDVICLRIGSCHGDDDPAAQRAMMQRAIDHGPSYPYTPGQYLPMWLSPRDMSHMLCCALEADCDWGIFYGISDNTPAAFDLSETKRVLGYRPQDNVQDLFDRPIVDLTS